MSRRPGTDSDERVVRAGRLSELAYDRVRRGILSGEFPVGTVEAGDRLALMVLSSDRDFTIRPPAGTQLTLDLARSSLALPVVGGSAALADATG